MSVKVKGNAIQVHRRGLSGEIGHAVCRGGDVKSTSSNGAEGYLRKRKEIVVKTVAGILYLGGATIIGARGQVGRTRQTQVAK